MDTELKSLRIDRNARRSKQPKRFVRYAVIAAVVILASVGGLLAYAKATAPVQVHAVQVKAPASGSAGQQVILTETGYIVAAHEIQVASKVVGKVAWIGVDKGDKVKAGQVLVRLENTEYQEQVTQQQGHLTDLEAQLTQLQNGSRPDEIAKARADVQQAKADLANAKSSLDRTQRLFSDGVLSEQAYDDAKAKYDADLASVNSYQQTLNLAILGPRKEQIAQAEGQVEQAKGALAYAKTQLADTVIRAPVSGTILDRNVEKGEFVTTGFVGDKGAKGYIVTMANLKDLQVELDVDESDFPKLGPHQKGWVTTDAYPDRKYAGEIEQVSPQADRAKATIQVKVQILNPDDYLRPEMNATVNFYNDTAQSASGKPDIVIPAGAVKNGSVFVVVNGRARKHAVTTAGASASGVLVKSGLIGGEEVIVNPPANLKNGQRVAVANS
ncbi:MAG TPA: efflux RND transporter periplasmic adaptor subunit [Bryobacteraceae bacterium]